MRKIEKQIIDAIRNNQDLKVANSQVINYTNSSDVYLHGHLLARIGETWMELFDAGYQTKTTKSRLNAILEKHGRGKDKDGKCERIYQKNHQWFLSTTDGDVKFTGSALLA